MSGEDYPYSSGENGKEGSCFEDSSKHIVGVVEYGQVEGTVSALGEALN